MLNETATGSGTGSGSGSGPTSAGGTRLHTNSISASTGTPGQLAVWTDSVTLGPADFTDSGGFLGIGTTTPQSAIHVFNPGAVMRLDRSSGTGNVAVTFAWNGTGVADFGVPGANDNFINGAVAGDFALRNFGGNMLFSTNSGNSSQMTLKSTGLIGMGTNSPTSALHVYNTAPVLRLERSSGTANSAVTFTWAGVDQADFGVPGVNGNFVNGSQAGDFALRNFGHNMLFSTNSGNSAQLYLKNGGNVGIGTTNPAQPLDVAGNINSSGSVTASVFSGSGASLTSLPAGNLTGTVPSAAISGTYSSAVTFSSASNSFSGSGANLTSLPAGNLTGPVPSGALSGTYSSAVTLSSASNSFTGNGANLTNVNAANLGGVTAAVLKTRVITYLGGCDSCAVLTNPADNQNVIYQNLLGATLTFTSITCFSDAGTPSIDIQRQNSGGTANLTAVSVGCSTGGTTVTNTGLNFNVTTLAANEKLNFLMTTPGTSTHRVTVIIVATL
jgi:hypothetical protein